MGYKEWLKNHTKKHKKIVDKLSHLNDEEILEYFRYENMKIHEKDFCPLYEKNKKCHDIDELNCYLCGCYNFRVDVKSSYCAINSKYGSIIEAKSGFIHQNCSKCIVPHKEQNIKNIFNRDLKEIFKFT